MPLSLNELAHRVCPRGGNLDAVTERLRHWARSELLTVLGGYPGKGRSRLFERGAVIDAALLNALGDIPGGSALEQGRLLLPCSVAREAAHAWVKDGRRRWLELV